MASLSATSAGQLLLTGCCFCVSVGCVLSMIRDVFVSQCGCCASDLGQAGARGQSPVAQILSRFAAQACCDVLTRCASSAAESVLRDFLQSSLLNIQVFSLLKPIHDYRIYNVSIEAPYLRPRSDRFCCCVRRI